MATNKPKDLDLDEKIRAEVSRIKQEHPYNGDYRAQLAALIETLFVKFGERAGASRLVTLLSENGRSPSTGTAQDEINKFWERIRTNAKIALPRPDLPEFLLDLFGDVAGKLWENAMAQAELTFAAQREDAESKVREAEVRAEAAQHQADDVRALLESVRAHAAEAERRREETALLLSAESAARDAAEQAAVRWEGLHKEEAAARAREAESMQKTIGSLQKSIERMESEQNRLLAVVDDYKQQAARDRQARDKTEEYNKLLLSQLRTTQDTVADLVKEKAALEGRLIAQEEQRKTLQQERDNFMHTSRDLEQSIRDLEAARDHWKGAADDIARRYQRAKDRTARRKLRRKSLPATTSTQ